MGARVTQQTVEVLATGVGKARVTQQTVEVLVSLTQFLRDAESALEFVETVDVRGPVYVDVYNTLGLTDEAVGYAGVVNVVVADTLAFQDVAGLVRSVSVNDALSLTDACIRQNRRDVSESLTLAQAVVAGKSKLAFESLAFAETVAIGKIIYREVVEQLNLMQACAIWTDGPARFDSRYTPFIGDGPGVPNPPPSVLAGPAQGVVVPFQLRYPATGTVTASCTLRTPNLGNRDRLSFNRVNRETRGGTLVVFADPRWPKTQTLVLSFSGLRRTEAMNLMEFLSSYLGQEIGLLDWEHRYWRGVVVTSDPLVEDSADRFSVGFEFEGELIPDWTP